MKLRVLIALVCLSTALLAQDHRQEAKFQPGGTVHLALSVGDFHIAPGSSDHILVTWTGRTADRFHVTINVSGNSATITTSNPHLSNNDVHFDIQLPAKSDLAGDISIGNATVGPFDGNADLGLSVGNLDFTVRDPQSFADVSISSNIGSLSSGPFAANQSGLIGKSMHWTGPGSHRLKLRVGTGNVDVIQAH